VRCVLAERESARAEPARNRPHSAAVLFVIDQPRRDDPLPTELALDRPCWARRRVAHNFAVDNRRQAQVAHHRARVALLLVWLDRQLREQLAAEGACHGALLTPLLVLALALCRDIPAAELAFFKPRGAFRQSVGFELAIEHRPLASGALHGDLGADRLVHHGLSGEYLDLAEAACDKPASTCAVRACACASYVMATAVQVRACECACLRASK
jgi:hypothetical protein